MVDKFKIEFFLFAILSLLACQKQDKKNTKAQWINDAFESLTSGEYPKIRAVSWWNENFDKSELRIDSSPESLKAFRKGIDYPVFISVAKFINNKLIAPSNSIYHSAFPDFGATEDIVSADRIFDYEKLAGKKIVWAYFSNNWIDSIYFPLQEVERIHNAGRIAFIRLMPRSNFDVGCPDSVYTMQKIIDGYFDAELKKWASDASKLGFPILCEFGTEVNGDWFSWNAKYNGANDCTGYGNPDLPDGAERFRDAYRHIINICRENNATNITWFFHVDAQGEPQKEWNAIKYYYPGDEYIDWLGVSIYGPQEKTDDYIPFSELLEQIYPVLTNLSERPIAILEFGVTELN